MERAVAAVVSGVMGCKKASIQFQLPQTTLERYVKKRRTDPNSVIDKTAGKYHCVLLKSKRSEAEEGNRKDVSTKKQKVIEARVSSEEKKEKTHYVYSITTNIQPQPKCKKWAHYSCAGIDGNDDESELICDICKPEYPIVPRRQGRME
ncbi:unnamed protein product [Acanthoscelides obtectus]|uniref:HTH psq-type domain-containing protein n=1 Tax=Acanthoscelides obtectus TaxID=200917 RepID=A0A9P0MEN9_ACAOB|nr:unnamed protein product [Acanthoscelides obtectus]CAK1633346.1 hypothetical protein AOBTE_LOCUS8060 [Acanthoscelides obtectus]